MGELSPAPSFFMEVYMNHHQRRGFQTNIKNDVYHIEERLQQYDPTLYLMYNPSTNEHLIMDGVTEMAIMKIPQIGFEWLDARVIERIRQIHTANGFNSSVEMKAHEERVQRERDRELEDMAYDYAKEMKDALNNAHTYGRIDGVQKYVSGVAI
jgi:hypothetical protein